MIKKEIIGLNKSQETTKERVGCRGIIIKDTKILLVHELKTDFYMIPGGGLEHGESLEECCIRELQEETGYIVELGKDGAFLEIDEYYGEYRFVDFYYMCEIVGTSEKNLTEAEAEGDLVTEWIEWNQALDIFSRHQDYASTFEEKRGAYLREYTALVTV